jgi:hypothetical protein
MTHCNSLRELHIDISGKRTALYSSMLRKETAGSPETPKAYQISPGPLACYFLRQNRKLGIKHESGNKQEKNVQMESSNMDKHGSKTLQHKESWPFWNIPWTSVCRITKETIWHSYCYICSVLCILSYCVVLCIVCV